MIGGIRVSKWRASGEKVMAEASAVTTLERAAGSSARCRGCLSGRETGSSSAPVSAPAPAGLTNLQIHRFSVQGRSSRGSCEAPQGDESITAPLIHPRAGGKSCIATRRNTRILTVVNNCSPATPRRRRLARYASVDGDSQFGGVEKAGNLIEGDTWRPTMAG